MLLKTRGALLIVAALGLAIYGLFLYRHTCFAVGGSDSSGYANAARALSRGRLVEPIEGLVRFDLPEAAAPVFLPLGFAHGPRPRTMAPLYPVGFPLHLAAAAALLGWEIGPYVVSPLAALLALLLLYLVGREMGLSPWAAVGAPLLLAACPVFIFQAIQPMSDVVATLWCLAALLCALRSRESPHWALAAGFCFGTAVLVRPIDALLCVPLAFAMPLERRRLSFFALGGAPCAAILFAYNAECFGGPFQTGYGSIGLGSALAWRHFPARLTSYSLWTSQVLTPFVGLGWAAALWDRRIPGRDRALLLSWFGVFFLFHCFYEPAAAWWFTRFLLPGLPAFPLGFLLLLRDVGRALPAAPRTWRRLAPIAAAVAVIFIVWIGFRNAKRWNVLAMNQMQAAFPEGCRWAAQTLPPGSLVLAGEMSGALRYYTELTPVRWDVLDPTTFRTLRSQTKTSGRGGRWFALLMRHEVPLAAPRVPGPWIFLGEKGPVSLWRLAEP